MRLLRERPRVAVLLVAATLAAAAAAGIAGAAAQGDDSAARQAAASAERYAAENERALAAARRRIATLELAQQRSEAHAERWQARALRAERKLYGRSSSRRR